MFVSEWLDRPLKTPASTTPVFSVARRVSGLGHIHLSAVGSWLRTGVRRNTPRAPAIVVAP